MFRFLFNSKFGFVTKEQKEEVEKMSQRRDLRQGIELPPVQQYPAVMTQGAVQSDPLQVLAGRFRDGDAEAFGQLHDAIAPGLIAFLTPRCRRELSADDLAQDVWTKAWKSRERFQDGHFRGWLFTIARNLLKDEYRKKRTSDLPEDFDPAEEATHSDSDGLDSLRDCLEKAESIFVAVVRDHLAGLSTDEIAERHDIKTATVYTRFDRGKKQLADCIQQKIA